jgi:3-oxoacyl-[acyl-carrier-protein] synthase II
VKAGVWVSSTLRLPDMRRELEQVWVTGIGLISSLGEGAQAHWTKLCDPVTCHPIVDEERFAPYPVHPLVSLDFSRQIPRTSDQRQMERWQRIGVYAAGLALDDAGLADNQEILDCTDLSIAAGNGERDIGLDARVLSAVSTDPMPDSTLNRELATGLRPTLYLGQLSNLLAGNISIVHRVTGSSRTFKGEEMAGVSALENAVERIEEGESELILVGGAFNAEREDALLRCELAQSLYHGPFRPVWDRISQGTGTVLGSVGTFLVVESANHARRRGAKPYARIGAIRSEHSRRGEGQASAVLAQLLAALRLDPSERGLPVLSGASGIEPATTDEFDFLARLWEAGFFPIVRTWGSVLGHSIEAHFITGVALAAMSIQWGRFYSPFDRSHLEISSENSPDQVLVTTLGGWRGEALGLVLPAH